MLSKRQMRRLIQSVYGANTTYGKQIEQLYRRASRQIKGEISAFIASKDSWSGKPSKYDLEDIRQQLTAISTPTIAPLVSVYLSSVVLGHPKNSDLETARVALPMLNVAKAMHHVMDKQEQQVPADVSRISREQHQLTPAIHPMPPNYDVMLQQSVSRSVTAQQSPATMINRDIQNTISRIKDVAKQASTSTDAATNWPQKVDQILTGNHSHGGASERAQRIIRTESCRQLNSSTISDFKARGVAEYRFFSLEADNSCADCTDLDGNVYDVDDAQEGVNLPPIHPNCQCWIVENEDENTDDMPTTDELMADEDEDE